jgi:hypothetical protein|tara:strand:+ start:1389 stop:1559 length:171 start_codon:yes stop_codon:yes gene_type:complete
MEKLLDLEKLKEITSKMPRDKLELLLMASLEEVKRLLKLLKDHGYEDEDIDDRTIN